MAMSLGSTPSMTNAAGRVPPAADDSAAVPGSPAGAPEGTPAAAAKGCTVRTPDTDGDREAWTRIAGRAMDACRATVGAAVGAPSVEIDLLGDPAAHAYAGTIRARRGAQEAQPITLEECRCDDEEIPAWIRDGVFAALKAPAVEEAADEPEPESEPEQAEPTEPSTTQDGADDEGAPPPGAEPEDEERNRARRIGIALTTTGGVLIAGGLATAIAGAVRISKFESHAFLDFVEIRKYEDSPYLLGIGSAVAVAGIAPLVIGLCNLRRARRGKGCLASGRRSERVSVLPWGGLGKAGVSVGRRF